MKKLIALMMLMFFSTASYAQVTNYGFENGDYSGWTVSNGSTTLKNTWSSSGAGVQVTTGVTNFCPGGGKCWTINPYGTYMATVQAGSGSPTFDTTMSGLGLSNSTITTIKNTIYSNGGMYPTNASAISRSVTLQAGMTYTFAWQYLSTDYVPYNDGSMITLTGGGVPTINGQTQNYALLGFTNPGTGNYSTDSYSATGWQVAQFTVPTDGTYVLGFSSFNLGDTALSPILFIDQMQGTTLLNGATFSPVAPNAGSSAPPPPPSEPSYPAATINASQQARINQTSTVGNNSVYISNIGDYASVTVEQKSLRNAVRGVGGLQYATLTGLNNSLTIYQGTTTASNGYNLAEVSVNGNGNSVSVVQEHNNKYLEMQVSGGSNVVSLHQNEAGGKNTFLNIAGSNNNLSLIQQGAANHFLDITLPTSGNTVSVTQSGAMQKMFSLTINTPNVGVSVTQTNATASDSAAMAITCNTGPCTGYSYVKN